MGDWKGIRTEYGKTILYNLATDMGENTDVADEFPDIVAVIEKHMDRNHVEDEAWPSTSDSSVNMCCDDCGNLLGCANCPLPGLTSLKQYIN